MRVKCKLSGSISWGLVGAWVKWGLGRWSNPLYAFAIWALVSYWKILFGKQSHNWSKIFFFNKLTYKSPSYASTPGIHRSLLISAWLTFNVSPVSALLCRRTSSQPAFLDWSLALDKEMKGMKLRILESFQSWPKPVGLSWFFPRWIFPI